MSDTPTTDTIAPTAAQRRPTSPWHIGVPAVISVITIVILTLAISRGWGQPERFSSVDVYRAVMNVAVMARLGPIFMAGIIVYPAMRLRGASIGWAGVGAVSSALAFGVISGVQALTFFPPAQAAYYVINPMVVAAIGSQIGCSAIGEIFVRWRRDPASLRSARFWLLTIAVAFMGFALFYVGVIWDGGQHWFYVWIRGFMLLFGTGQ